MKLPGSDKKKERGATSTYVNIINKTMLESEGRSK